MGQEVCAPWTDPDRLCKTEDDTAPDNCSGADVPLDRKWTADEVVRAASNILYARTCYRYPGVCEYSVWPCIDQCCSDRHPCVPCYRYKAIALPGELTVVAITEITEDDVVLDPAAYRLDGNRVVRIDDLQWQRNTFGLPGALGVETVITFTAGAAPPIELEMAAADLADEMWKSCNGGACQLDPKVRSYVSRGVAVELNDIVKLLGLGMTGIPSVDRAIQIHGNCGGATMMDTAEPYRGQRVI